MHNQPIYVVAFVLYGCCLWLLLPTPDRLGLWATYVVLLFNNWWPRHPYGEQIQMWIFYVILWSLFCFGIITAFHVTKEAKLGQKTRPNHFLVDRD